MSTEKKTKEKTKFPTGQTDENTFGTRGSGGGHPGKRLDKLNANKNKLRGEKHLRVSLIEFDEAGRQRWAAAHNHCRSINLLWLFFYPPVRATELVTT